MATWDDVERIAMSLPEAQKRNATSGRRQWAIRNRLFVWERPLRKPDLAALGGDAPTGPILGARVEHLVAKEALLADDPRVFFTIPHFDGYSAVLIRLGEIAVPELEEITAEAWLSVAPKRLVTAFLERRGLA